MSSKRFKWIDRDHAARDLIQIAYHAPPYVSRQALQLLEAILSPAVIPDLEVIVQDEERDMWERKYALRVISKTPGSYDLPFLARYMEQTLVHWVKQIRLNPDLDPEEVYVPVDLLGEIVEFVDRNPANQEWFLAVLDHIPEAKALKRFLMVPLYIELTPDFHQRLVQRLLNLLDQNLDLMSPLVLAILTGAQDTNIRLWLNAVLERLNTILELSLQYPVDRHILSAAEDWAELKHRLILRNADFEVQFRNYQQEMEETCAKRWDNTPSDFRTSPAYQYLEKLYLEALQGNEQSSYRLVSISKHWYGDIPVRAVATHFLGQLQTKYDLTTHLLHLLKHANDDWGNEISPYSPIRIEAGEAMINSPTPQVWEAFIDAFFINSRNILEDFIIDWIAYITNRLSGIENEYNGDTWGSPDDRRWFQVLAEISEEEFKRELPF